MPYPGFDGPDPEYVRYKHRIEDKVPFPQKVIMGILVFVIVIGGASFVSRLL
jgi:hypothetical protein